MHLEKKEQHHHQSSWPRSNLIYSLNHSSSNVYYTSCLTANGVFLYSFLHSLVSRQTGVAGAHKIGSEFARKVRY